MEQVVLLVLKLLMFPMVSIGAALLLAQLFVYLRGCKSLTVCPPANARVVTVCVAALALWLMRDGFPSRLENVWDAIVAGCYIACAFTGGRWLWERRARLLGWVRSTFELR